MRASSIKQAELNSPGAYPFHCQRHRPSHSFSLSPPPLPIGSANPLLLHNTQMTRRQEGKTLLVLVEWQETVLPFLFFRTHFITQHLMQLESN